MEKFDADIIVAYPAGYELCHPVCLYWVPVLCFGRRGLHGFFSSGITITANYALRQSSRLLKVLLLVKTHEASKADWNRTLIMEKSEMSCSHCSSVWKAKSRFVITEHRLAGDFDILT